MGWTSRSARLWAGSPDPAADFRNSDKSYYQTALKINGSGDPLYITGDAVIQKINNLWIMFYFGAFWEDRKDAFNRFACSFDLVNWTDWNGDDLIKPSEGYDQKFAHKSFFVKSNGIVYHFYCAVNNKDQRGIAVATSTDKGKSKLHFTDN